MSAAVPVTLYPLSCLDCDSIHQPSRQAVPIHLGCGNEEAIMRRAWSSTRLFFDASDLKQDCYDAYYEFSGLVQVHHER